MKKIREVLRLKFDRGATTREIAQSCKLSVSTVSEYLYRAGASGHSWPLPESLSDAELERSLYPPRAKAGAPSRPVPDWAEVRSELSRKGVTLLLLWREYRAEHPDGYGYARFAALFSQWEKRSDVRMLQRHKAGEKMFVDFAGLTMEITNPETGELSQAQVFVAAMGSSQKVFARAYAAQDTKSWLLAHVEAFAFYGALPRALVPDNLKAAVASPCYYEPALNQAYLEFAQFYELTVLPARVRAPRDKAKVENAVQQVERWVLAPLRRRVFLSLSELNEAISELVAKLNVRVMKGPNASRDDLFKEEDLPAMRPLPASAYAYAQWKAAKVAPDYHVEFEGHRYSVPYALVGRKIEIRASAHLVEVFLGSQKVASHPRSLRRRGFTTQEAHLPESHRAGKWTPERLKSWSAKIGPQAELLAHRILSTREHPEHSYRTILGILRLEKRYTRERLEAACLRANTIGALTYGSVRAILQRNLEKAELQPELPPLPMHDNVRGAGYYSDGSVPCDN